MVRYTTKEEIAKCDLVTVINSSKKEYVICVQAGMNDAFDLLGQNDVMGIFSDSKESIVF